jgi:hypothetical protein
VVQFDVVLSKRILLRRKLALSAVEGDLGEPREVSRSLRHISRAFGSLPCKLRDYQGVGQTCMTTPVHTGSLISRNRRANV